MTSGALIHHGPFASQVAFRFELVDNTGLLGKQIVTGIAIPQVLLVLQVGKRDITLYSAINDNIGGTLMLGCQGNSG